MPPKLRMATGVAVAGAILIAAGPLLGVVRPAIPAGFTSWPWLLVIGLLPAVLAGQFARRGSVAAAATVLLPGALLAPGRLLGDLQVAADAGLAVRPELLLPGSLDPVAPAAGLWLIAAGHLAAVLAGILAALSLGDVPAQTDGAGAGPSHEVAGGVGMIRRQGLLAVVMCVAVLAAVGLAMAPMASSNPYLLPKAIVDSPPLVLVGGLLVTLAVPVCAGLAATSESPDIARSGLLGTSLAVVAVGLPSVLAAVLREDLTIGSGPTLAVLAACVLAAVAVPAGRPREPREAPADEVPLPAFGWPTRVAGIAALVSGVAALVASWTPQLAMPPNLPTPPAYAARMLVPAGALFALLGGASLLPGRASVVRPALAVTSAAVPLAGAAVLDTVLTAVGIAGVRAGPGAWAVGLAVPAAAVSGGFALLAGVVERDDVDRSQSNVDRAVAGPAMVAAALAVAAFALPAVNAPEYTAPGVFHHFDTTSWGLLLALCVAGGAAALAPLCRPGRAVSLLLGVVFVLVVRALEYPLTAERAAGSTPGPGGWCAAGAVLAALVTAAVALRRARASAPPPGSAEGRNLVADARRAL